MSVFAVQFDREADIQTLALDSRVAEYWRDPGWATTELLAALKQYYPLSDNDGQTPLTLDAERRYRELALQSCDIIDLANLPEDRHAATRQLELRRLYVPLRIRVEAVPQTEGTDEQLEAIERRRQARRRGSSPWTQEDTVGRAPIGERLAKARRLIVLGDPGAGKSTVIVRWLATAYLLRLKHALPDWQALPMLPLFPQKTGCPSCFVAAISTRPVSRSKIFCATFCVWPRSPMRSPGPCNRSWPRASRGTALLLIDGLDEISDPIAGQLSPPPDRTHFSRPSQPCYRGHLPHCGYIANNWGYRIGRGFKHVSVDDFSPKTRTILRGAWCTLTQVPGQAEAAAIDLIKDIHSTSRIERLTGNPMMLTTMALVKRKVGKLPRRRIDLYWEAVQVLLNWRSEVDQPIDHREALPQLEYVAYAMCQQGAQQLRDDEIIGLFERMREEYPRIHAVKAHTPEEFLTLLERRTGILVQAGQVRHQGRSVPVYEFRHLTFQEYLAALALVDGRFPERDSSRTEGKPLLPWPAEPRLPAHRHLHYRGQRSLA